MVAPGFKDMDPSQIDSLIARVEAAIAADGDVSAQDLRLLLEVFKGFLHLQERLAANDLTIQRLKKLLGMISSSEKRRDDEREGKTGGSNPGGSPGGNRGRPHGKRSADEFVEAKTEHHHHPELRSGQECPDCSRGKIYKFAPSQFLRISGHAPLQATIHVAEQLRCNHCQKVYKAPLPQALLDDGEPNRRFGYSAVAMTILLKYAAGTPFFRQQTLQSMLAVPVTASSMWDLCEEAANVVKPVFDLMTKTAAQATVFYSDDTRCRILSQEPIKKRRRGTDKERSRTGVHTSGIIAVMPGGTNIILYKTGINHAGEFFDLVLGYRPADMPKFIHMSDALSGNNATVREGVEAKCNSHARRQINDLKEKWPAEVDFVLDAYEQVYKVDSEAKELNLDSAARLQLHASKSRPIMENLMAWAADQLKEKYVEPNSPLGGALKYLLKHKDGLMAFCHHEDAPLDNNLQEQKLKIVVLHRKNSLFFKESVGAWVADILMSTCATASSCGINVFDYLVTLQREAQEVKRNPSAYLPWNIGTKLRTTNLQ